MDREAVLERMSERFDVTVIGTGLVAVLYVGNDHGNEGWRVFGAVVIGLVLAQIVSRLTEYFTSTERQPVQEIAESTRTGPATTVLSGMSSGLESTVWSIVAIAVAIGAGIILGDVPGDRQARSRRHSGRP